MVGFGSRKNHLRQRSAGSEAPVESVELFFDLVFVFAITQLSHYLLHRLSLSGAFQAALLLFAVWWVWVYTAWCTNWLNPRRMPVRIMLFVLMLAGLVLSTSIPDAFGGRGSSFAGAYVFMQLGRTSFMLWALARHSPANFRNFQRIIIWLVVSSIFWIAGGVISDPTARFALWLVALMTEYVSPALGFRVPGMGASMTADWDVAGGYLAERVGLFVIIALGESVLAAGSNFAGLGWNGTTVGAFLTAFAGTVSMWWIYFNVGADYASRKISESRDPGRLGRLAYTYLPIVFVGGIIVSAVGDDLMLARPWGGEEAGAAALFTIAGGAALYVLGNLFFKASVSGHGPLSHLVGLALFVILLAFGSALPPLIVGAFSTAILILVAAWEFVSLKSLRE